MLADTRVRVFPELPALEERFRELSAVGKASPKVWVDAYLAARAEANGAQLGTFDRGLGAPGVDCLILGE